jgi:hypothetical protein
LNCNWFLTFVAAGNNIVERTCSTFTENQTWFTIQAVLESWARTNQPTSLLSREAAFDFSLNATFLLLVSDWIIFDFSATSNRIKFHQICCSFLERLFIPHSPISFRWGCHNCWSLFGESSDISLINLPFQNSKYSQKSCRLGFTYCILQITDYRLQITYYILHVSMHLLVTRRSLNGIMFENASQRRSQKADEVYWMMGIRNGPIANQVEHLPSWQKWKNHKSANDYVMDKHHSCSENVVRFSSSKIPTRRTCLAGVENLGCISQRGTNESLCSKSRDSQTLIGPFTHETLTNSFTDAKVSY